MKKSFEYAGRPLSDCRTILDTATTEKIKIIFTEETTQDVQSEEKKKGLSGKAKKYVYINCYCSYLLNYFTYYNFIILLLPILLPVILIFICDFHCESGRNKKKSHRGAMRDFEEYK